MYNISLQINVAEYDITIAADSPSKIFTFTPNNGCITVLYHKIFRRLNIVDLTLNCFISQSLGLLMLRMKMQAQLIWDLGEDVETVSKWLPFFRRHFQMQFREWKCMNFAWNFTEVVSKSPSNNIPAMVQIMAWRRSGDKPLPERMKT